MKRKYVPSIRLVSSDHDKTIIGAQVLRNTMRSHALAYDVMDVFCHLETSRCGLPVGSIGIEVDGRFIYVGEAITANVAEAFCKGLPGYVEEQKKAFGIS